MTPPINPEVIPKTTYVLIDDQSNQDSNLLGRRLSAHEWFDTDE